MVHYNAIDFVEDWKRWQDILAKFLQIITDLFVILILIHYYFRVFELFVIYSFRKDHKKTSR